MQKISEREIKKWEENLPEASPTIIREVKYIHTCKNGTTATIVFTSRNSPLIFTSCTYNIGSSKALNNYTIEDWADMQELSGEILKLNSLINSIPVVIAS